MFLDPRFWLAISFLIFLTLLIKYIVPKIITALDNKSKQIANDIEQAKQIKEKAEELLLKTKQYHQESLLYCKKLIDKTKKETEKLLADSQNSLEQELINKTNLAKNRIRQEEEKIIRDIKLNIITSAIKIIEKKSQNLTNHSSSDSLKRAAEDISKMIH